MPRLTYAALLPLRARTAAIVVVAAVLLSGCQGGSPTAGNSETHTTTASPTSSVSSPVASAAPPSSGAYKPADASGKAQNVPVPVMPELAKENSKAGLEAFIGYWYEVKNYANQTGDTAVLASLSSASCRLCKHMEEAASDSYREGRWMVGGALHLSNVEMDWKPEELSHLARAQVVQDKISYFNADGSAGRPSDIATNDAFVILTQFSDSWKVVDTGVIR